ncbi:MAG: hypothetical protein MK111_23780 [Crocosphaera sp.]|uniref:hypothetical protein n=1 Tax=Crocosphaera sp. TaxID=2729996 RepID=UPI002580B589|nr:hypothetical protein [Crocosphaera sp.]MCH2247614.1 hypothetical protein [Crocosphaera sp.]NQZ65205.1 hypothetical protein [Crocosphaera sp.]
MKITNLLVNALTGLVVGPQINPSSAQTIRFKGEREMAQECVSIAKRVYSQATASSRRAVGKAENDIIVDVVVYQFCNLTV